MEKLTYPLLCFELDDHSVLGLLVGTKYQMVEKDVKSLKMALNDHLAKEYKRYYDYPGTGLPSPKLKRFDVKVRPAVRSKEGTFPSNTLVKVPIYAVYGSTDQHYFECYLPLLNEHFFYYDQKQLGSLVQHFTTTILNQQSPEEVYRLMMTNPPFLEEVVLKIHPHKEIGDYNWSYEERYPTLSGLAERYPQSKSVKRNTSAFPEAAWELEDKVEEVLDKIVSSRSNVLVVGKSGVGKSAVLKQAMRKLAQSSKKSKVELSFWQLIGQRITATSKYLGEWQQTVEELVDDLMACNGILWVIDVIQLLQIGGEGPEDSVAAFITAFLQQNKIQMIGELTPQELESMRRLLPGFVENFQIVKVEEASEKKVFNILEKFGDFSEKNLKIKLEKQAQELTYRLLLRYYPYESFPGKAIKFLSQCVNDAFVTESTKINKRGVIDNFVKQTGMPELFLRDDLLLEDQELRSFFQGRIIGQEMAISTLIGVVKIFKAGLNNPGKPINTLIFAGPTGVGKTASTKALADYFFGKGQKKSPLIRIDMSEFQHPSQLSRFIGVGKEVGKLVQEIRERPFSVLLLDEVEKADPSIFDALLTVLDEGILVDTFGRVTNFRNTIIIMTTNLGASNRTSIGFGGGSEASYDSAIGSHFRPEFVNRIDNVVLFNALNEDNIRQITIKELKELEQREGFEKRNLKLNFDKEIIVYLTSIGFDERYGARPLQRALEDEIVSPLAKWMLENPYAENMVLKISRENKELKIVKGKKIQPA